MKSHLSCLLNAARAFVLGRRKVLLHSLRLFVLGLALGVPAAYAALGASLSLVPAGSISPGQVTTLRITLSNSSESVVATGVAFSNSLPGTLPNGLKVAGAPSSSCGGSLTAALNTQAISLSGGTIPMRTGGTDGSCVIEIPVTAGTSSGDSATYSYTIASGAVTGSVTANSGSVTQAVNVNAMARPIIAKSFSDNVVTLGGAARTLTITVSNPSAVPLPNFSLTDVFPQLGGQAIIKVGSPAGATSTCTAGGTPASFNPVADATSVSASGGTVAAGGSCTLTVPVVGNQTHGLYDTDLQTNTIDRNTQFNNDLGIKPSINATAPVRVRSPLRVTKAFAHNFLSNSYSDSFTITLHNDGDTDLTVTTLDDNPIDGIAGTGFGLVATSGSTTCAGGSVSLLDGGDGIQLSGGTIPANGSGSCTVTVNFTGTVENPGQPKSYTNTIAAGAVVLTQSGIVSQKATAAILVADDLHVLKEASPNVVAPGNPIRYTVTVKNYGVSAINNIVVNDQFTHGQTYLTGTINGINYTPSLSGTGCSGLTENSVLGQTNANFTIATLPARTSINSPGSCSITFYAMSGTAAANGSSTANQIPANQVCYNAGTTCNGSASEATTGTVSTTVLSLAKAFNLTSPQPEGTITRMTIALTNQSANALTNLAIADTLPTAAGGGQMRVANPANASSTCGSPTITAVPGDTSVAMNGGTVPGRASNGTGVAGTCFLQVDVVAGAGVYSNTATATATETYANGATHIVGPASDTAPFTFNSSLGAIKSFNPASVSSGGKSTVTVRLSNSGAVALSDVSVTDPLPPGMVLAASPNAYSTCAGPTSITAVAGASSVSLTGAALAGNSNCDFIFDVVATGTNNWINTIPVGNITAAGGISNQSTVSGTLNYNAPSHPSITKVTNPSSLTFLGQVSQLTIVIENGSQAVTNLALIDNFTVDGTPGAELNGMVIAPTPAASSNCPGGIVSALPGGTSVSISGVSLGANATCTLNVNVTSNKVGGITNYIPVGRIVTDQGLTNAGQAATSLSTSANLGVTKQFTPNVIRPGERSRLRITIHNPTTKAVSNIQVTDNLPTGVTVPAGPSPYTSCSGATVTAPTTGQVLVSGGSIAGEASCYAEIDVTAASQGDYLNTIPAGGLTGTVDGGPVTNPQPTEDTLHVKAPLSVHKAFSNLTLDAAPPVGFSTGTDSKSPGVAFTLAVRLVNSNSVPLTGAAFTDVLPTGLVVATTPAASTTCADGTVIANASATQIRLTGGTIPANSFCTVTVNVLSNISDTYTNTIGAGEVSTTEGVSNEEPTSAQVVISTPPTVSKQFEPGVIPPNGTSRLTIFIGNDNGAPITLTSLFTDTLPTAPGNIVVAGTPNASTTCNGGAGVAAVNGSDTVSLANGATIPAGGCAISVDVTGLTPGVHTNNIPAGELKTSVGNNQQPANAPLTISTLGYISGKVFRDNNVTPNGTFEVGTDGPIAGETISLYSGGNCSGTLLETTTTDLLGNYLFSGLAAGTYSVCQPNQPAGTSNGGTTAGMIVPVSGSGGAVGTASNPSLTSSQIVGIQLTAAGGGEVSGSTGNNFAEIVPSSIAGTIFLDQNNNGLKNGPDAGIADVPVELLDSGGTVIATTITDADGNYRFDNLQPGTYSVREPLQPANTANGITTAGVVANGGTPGSATPVTTEPSMIAGIVLPPNTLSTGNNFAEIPHGRSVSGWVFLDYNNNGVLDGGASDHGIGGQTVNLTGTDVNGNPVSRSVTTAADGRYSFTGLPEGTYTVSQPSQPSGTSNGIPTAGSTGGTASNPSATTSQILNLDLTGANMVSAENNFAEMPDAAPDLAISKTHSPVSFGAGSSTGYFTITPRNIGTVATSGVVTIVDTLPVGMTVAAPATGSGWSCVGAVGASLVTCTTSSVIAANSNGNPIILRVAVAADRLGQILVNRAVVSGGGEPPGFDGNNSVEDPVAVSDTAQVSGRVWLDSNSDRVYDPGEPVYSGWGVELLLDQVLVASTTTNGGGTYSFTGVAPGSGYNIRFRHPETGVIWGSAVPNEQGLVPASGARDTGSSVNTGQVTAGNPAGATLTGDGLLTNLILLGGDNIVEQSLPIDPAGVVYNAVTRAPVSGAVVTISGPGGFDPAVHVVGGNASVTTGSDGMYQFLLIPGAPNGIYTLTVTTYPAGYLPLPSSIIPVCSNTLSVNTTAIGPDPAQVQPLSTAPAAGVDAHDPAACPVNTTGFPVNNTQYYFSFNLTAAGAPFSANVINNHIPLDPVLGGAIIITKTTPSMNVTRGDLVPYTITATNTLSTTLANIDVQDQLPPGFKYRNGSASLNGVYTEPVVSGRLLNWQNQTFAPNERKTYRLVLVVGAGVGEGEYVNQAWAMNSLASSRVSNIGSAMVRVVPDPTFDCSDIIGKVFNDQNANGYQDQGEPGIPNVRLATARGLLVTTDAEGRFHVTCAAIPQADRGSNFVMKLDERTLPSGFRVTTENPRDVRVTRGKMVKLNFGATVHKVLRVELDARAFVAGEISLLPQWQQRLPAIVNTLQEQPSVLRLAYRAVEGDEQGAARLKALAAQMGELYQEARKTKQGTNPSETEDEAPPEIPPLLVETEVFNQVREGK